MQKEHHPRDKRRDVVFICVALLVIIADQLSKAWIKANLALGQSLIDIGFFQIIRIHNTGASFGLFKDHTPVLLAVSFIGIVAILVIFFYLHNRLSFLDSMLFRVAIGLVLGGTIGNQIDRLLDGGRVTDFIDFKVWPVFNIADSSAVVGTIIIAYCIIFLSQRVKHQE
jgi:signal peptidase II